MEEEQRQGGIQAEWLLATTKELVKAWTQSRSLEEELMRAKEFAATKEEKRRTEKKID